MNNDEVRAALAAMNSARAHVAQIAECPPWRHAAFGVVMGTLVLAPGMDQPLHSLLFGGSMLGVLAIAADDRRRYGMFVNGYRKGRTRALTFVLLAIVLGMVAGEVRLRSMGASLPCRLVLGAVAVVVTTGFSVIWNRIFRREMSEAA